MGFGAYASIADLKGVLGITSTTDDTVMRKILEAASRSIDNYCNRIFFTQTATKYFDGDYKLWLPDLLSITTLKTDEDGNATFENTLATTDYLLYGTGLEDSLNTFPKTRVEISEDSDYSSFASGIRKGVEIVGIWGYGDGISATPYITDTTITEDLTAGESAIDVTSVTNLSAGQLILIGSEQYYIYSIATLTLTVEAGVNGTTEATHSSGATINIYQYPSDIRQACIDLGVALYQNRAKQGLQTERLGDYCLPTTAEALTMNGWRNSDTLKTNDKILAYNPELDKLEWADVLNIHKSQYKGKMLQLKSRKGIDTLASPNHRWYVKPLFHTAKWQQRIHTSEELNTWDRIPLSAPFNNKAEKIFSDDFVECVGWFVTEGNWQYDSDSKRKYAAFINQVDKHKDYCDSIRKCLHNLLGKPVAEHNHGYGNVGFYIPAQTKLLQDLYDIVPNKQLTMDFITRLTNEQLRLLWETMLKGDGDNGRYRFYQKANETMDTFQVLSVLCGFGTRLSKKDIHKPDDEAVYNLSCQKPIRGVREIRKGWVDYDGEIWCPETSLGTWVARDNGSTFITGNSYTVAGTSLGKSMVESILESIRPYKRMRF